MKYAVILSPTIPSEIGILTGLHSVVALLRESQRSTFLFGTYSISFTDFFGVPVPQGNKTLGLKSGKPTEWYVELQLNLNLKVSG